MKTTPSLNSFGLALGLGTMLLLAGCESLDKMEADNYRHKCESLGINRGSPAYENCILQQQALEEQSIQHSMDRSAEREMLKKMHIK